MAKVTSKLQVTIPKTVADQYGIRPGTDLRWVPAGDVIRVEPPGAQSVSTADLETRLQLFDEATRRQRARNRRVPRSAGGDRGWKREDLYRRGRTR